MLIQLKVFVMKTHFLTLIIAIMALFGFGSASGQDASYKQLWEKVKEADKKDLPKTAVEICDKIIAKADAYVDGKTGIVLEISNYPYGTEDEFNYSQVILP